MKTLRLQHGDLVLGQGGVETISGPSMLIQDIRGALGEPFGIDRFHPGWGSVIDEYVGAPLDESTAFEIKQEVSRVVGNYMAVQADKIQRDSMTSGPNRYRSSDVLARVRSIDVTTHYDQATVAITVETVSREEATVQVDVGGSNG